jgi:hypothetical protein
MSDPITSLLFVETRDIIHAIVPYFLDFRDLVNLNQAIVNTEERHNYRDIFSTFHCREEAFYSIDKKKNFPLNRWMINHNLLSLGEFLYWKPGWEIDVQEILQMPPTSINRLRENICGHIYLKFDNIRKEEDIMTVLEIFQNVQKLSFANLKRLDSNVDSPVVFPDLQSVAFINLMILSDLHLRLLFNAPKLTELEVYYVKLVPFFTI